MLAICRRKGLKGRFIVRAHGYDYDVLQNGRGYFPFRESEMSEFDHIVQISEYGLLKMQKQYPRAKNLMLQKLGVMDNGLNPISEKGAKYRIVSCSNFVKLKRLPLMIDILSHLELDFEWVHFGWGEGADDIVKLAGQKLKPGSFEFRGITPNAEILRYYRENPVDLVMNVSELEGIPVSLMEAVASGIPVAGCNVCGVPEIVCKETGLLLNNEPKPKDTAIQIRTFLEEQARNMEFRRSVKSFWEKKYNSNNNYRQFIEKINNERI
jgi:glycosyltransferase involved in cell wall biosynthesis